LDAEMRAGSFKDVVASCLRDAAQEVVGRGALSPPKGADGEVGPDVLGEILRINQGIRRGVFLEENAQLGE
jgi:hypothetical protein